MKNMNQPSTGFTLIEVLIVVALIGILSAIAFPSYSDYVRKTRRSDAHLVLLNTSQALERCKATAYVYTDCRFPNNTKTAATDTSDHYAFTLVIDASSFTITATAKSTQLKDTECKKITLNHLGVTSAKDSADADNDECWG